MGQSLLALCLIGALAAGCAAMLGTQGRTATGSSTTAVQNVPWPPGTPIPRAQYARLTWTSPGVTEEVRIQRRDGTDLAAQWVDLGGIVPGVTTTKDVGLFEGRSYCYRVKATTSPWVTREVCNFSTPPTTGQPLTVTYHFAEQPPPTPVARPTPDSPRRPGGPPSRPNAPGGSRQPADPLHEED
jgi:hypothetical protein